VAPAAAVVLSVVVIGLAMRNGPVIWRLNAQPIEQFGERALQSLPAGGGVVLCDFPEKLLVFEAALARRHQTVNWLAVDTHELPKAEYRAELERRQPGAWLTDTTRHELTQLETLRLLAQVAQKHRLFYLHPSYGYFFERFYLEPVGTVFEMKLRGKDPLDVPPLSSAALESNETFWTRVWSQDLARLAPPVSRPNPLEKQLARVGLVPAPQREDRVLADWYSVPLDAWGVALQEQGHLREAQVRFEQALQLNTKNFSARISLACNTNLQAGAKIGVGDIAQVAGELGNPDKLNLMVTADGPFDEATLHYLLGSSYLDHGLLIQAAEQIERVRTLVPGGLAPELALAEIYNRLQMTSRSRPLITHLREAARKLPANSALDLDVAMVDSYSWLLQTNAAQARDVLQAVASEHPDDPKVTGRVLIAYVALRDWTNAVRLVDAQLAKAPDDTQMLNDKAMILMQAGRSADAIALLDHVLLLTNLPAARLNRAFVRLSKENFTLAADDLRELENEGINSPMVSFGLAAVAEHSHDTNQAVHYLQICLTNTPAGGPLWQQANARLQSLKSAAAVK
jgi:tetratricopeptide (TPR) repeat protein